MDIREQRNHSQAQELINLANDVLADWCGTTRLFNYKNPYDNPKFKELAKLERKFNKHHKNKLVDVGEYLEKFSIELSVARNVKVDHSRNRNSPTQFGIVVQTLSY